MPDLSPRASRQILWAAIALFVVMYVAYAGVAPFIVSSEVTSLFPLFPQKVLKGAGIIVETSQCSDGQRWVVERERPYLSLCLFGRLYPVMASPYISTVFSWPLEIIRAYHHDNVLKIHPFLFPTGILVIVLAYKLIARLDTRRSAAYSALFMAVTPLFIILHTSLWYYETLPWVFLLLSLLLLIESGFLNRSDNQQQVSTWRFAFGGLFIGLTLLANLKSIVHLFFLIILAIVLGVRPRPIRPGQVALAILCTLLPLVPILVHQILDPTVGFTGNRAILPEEALQRAISPTWWLMRLSELIRWWGSPARVLPGNDQGPLVFEWPGVMFACAALVLALLDVIRKSNTRNVVLAGCLSLIISSIAIVFISGSEYYNLVFLHPVFGVVLGCTCSRLVTSPRLTASVLRSSAIVAIVIAPFFVTSINNISEMGSMRYPFNLSALLEARDALDDSEPIYTRDDMIASVFDSISEGRYRTTHLSSTLFDSCHLAQFQYDSGCLVERWKAILARVEWPFKLIMPVDRRWWASEEHVEALKTAASESGLTLSLLRAFAIPGDSEPVLAIFRVSGSG